MNNQIKEAFKTIKASDVIKSKTRSFVIKEINNTQKTKRKKLLSFPRLATVCISLILILFGGQWLYFTQTALISIDINPSIELGINRFDRVISAEGLNEDGSDLLKNLNLFNKTSTEAVNEVLADQKIITLETENEVITITVSSKNQNQSETILTEMKQCTEEHPNAQCHALSEEETSDANSLGLPNGKYRAYLALKEYEPTITPEEISGMTMREIRDRINSYENTNSSETDKSQCSQIQENQETDHHGYQHQYHHGQNHE